jgi:hypothetical protein
MQNERRLLVHLPKRWGQSRMWCSSVPDEEQAGEPVEETIGATGAQVVGETLRLWSAATREAIRGRSAYRALVLQRCRVGRELGATLALTKANIATSGPTLERTGFRVVATERRYALEVS